MRKLGIKCWITILSLSLNLNLPFVLAQDEIRAALSDIEIDELETVRLSIKAFNTRETERLDLSALEDDFQVMGTNTNSQYRYINGRSESWVEYAITLQPKKTGTLRIPPIRVGGKFSDELSLFVKPLSLAAREKMKEQVFYEIELSTDRAFVQSQILIKRTLFYANGVKLYGKQLGPPNIKGASVFRLGENISGEVTRNGNYYGYLQQRFAVFPEQSGTIVVPAEITTASVPFVERGRFSRRGVQVETPEKTIQILPIPDEYPKDQAWIPAEKLTISQTFSGIPDGGILGPGDSITQEIKATFWGNTSAISDNLLPPLDLTAFREYPEPPTLENNALGETLVGERLERRAIQPKQNGLIVIPDLTIVWWDTAQNRVRETRALGQQLTAEGLEAVEQNRSIKSFDETDPMSGRFKPESLKPSTALADQIVTDEYQLSSSNWFNSRVILILAILFSIIGAYIMTMHIKRRKAAKLQSKSLKRKKQELLQAIQSENPQKARAALYNWLRKSAKDDMHNVVEKFAEQSDSQRKLILLLDSTSFSQERRTLSREEKLFAIEVIEKASAEQIIEKRTNALPPLYPTMSPS